jgi:hypothetical protein
LHHSFTSELIKTYMETLSNQPFIFIVVSVHKLMLSISFCRMVCQPGNQIHEKNARVAVLGCLKHHLAEFQVKFEEIMTEINDKGDSKLKDVLLDLLFSEGSQTFELASFKEYQDTEKLTKVIRVLDHYYSAQNLMEFLKSSVNFTKSNIDETLLTELQSLFKWIIFCEINIQKLKNQKIRKNF